MIKDSGERREFDSGAVRDITEGKGRFDLVPLDAVAEITKDVFIYNIAKFQAEEQPKYLVEAINKFSKDAFGDFETAMLEVAIHFEEGAKKYGENNWQKGIPFNSYIDSTVRHYYKWKRGADDERHDRAVIWNLLCLYYEGLWSGRTCENCKYYVREPESQLYEKCMKDSSDTTVHKNHRCKKWQHKML